MQTMNHSDVRMRPVLRLVLAVIYFGVGVVHVARPEAFLPIMPDWVPEPRLVVLATGVCELIGSVALLTERLRRWARYHAGALCRLRLPGQYQARTQ